MTARGDFEAFAAHDDRHMRDCPLTPPWDARPSDDGPPTPPLDAYADEIGRSVVALFPGVTAAQVAPARASRFYSAASLAGRAVPDREWLVHGLVPKRTVTLFSGDGGTGKSLLALQLAIGVVAGCGWLGKPVTRGRAILLSAEDDDDELHRRTDDVLRAQGLTYDQLEGLTLRSLAGEDALLAVETKLALAASSLFAELETRAEDDKPDLIILDTLADVYPANENDRALVRQFVGILRGLALRRNCAVLLLGHPSLTGLASGSGTSGSTAWNNSVRSRLYLERIADDGYEPDVDLRRLTTKKANYGRTGGETLVRYSGGAFVVEAQPDGLDAVAASAKAERVFLKLLRQLRDEGRDVNHAPCASFAPKVFAEHPDRERVRKAAFLTAMNALLSRGAIVIRKSGPSSRVKSWIEEASE